MSRHTTILFGNKDKYRMIAYYPLTKDICRTYGVLLSGNNIIDQTHKFGIKELCNFLPSISGRALRSYNLSDDEVRELGNKFEKSAIKAGFIRIGTAQYDV